MNRSRRVGGKRLIKRGLTFFKETSAFEKAAFFCCFLRRAVVFALILTLGEVII